MALAIQVTQFDGVNAAPVANALVAAIIPNDGGATRVFLPEGATTGASANLPSIKSITAVSQVDGSFGGSGSSVTGAWKVALTAAATDTVNTSSPLEFLLNANSIVLTATG
jgi:hypothetical protein